MQLELALLATLAYNDQIIVMDHASERKFHEESRSGNRMSILIDDTYLRRSAPISQSIVTFLWPQIVWHQFRR